MWMTALLVSAATAQSLGGLDAAALSERARAIAPAVERAAGRPFDEVPDVVVLDRRQVRDMLVAQWADRLDRAGVDEDPAEAAAAELGVVDRAAAAYSAQDGRIYAIGEQFRQNALDFDPAVLSGVIDCILAHELTHALQQRYAPERRLRDADTAARVTLLHEGHAVLVARRVCQAERGTAATLAFDQVTGVGAVVGPESDGALAYAFAPLWLAAIEREHGWEAVWQALSDAPPERDALRDAAAGLRVDGWEDPGDLPALVSQATRDEGTVATPSSTSWMAGVLSGHRGGGPVAELPASAAGYAVTAERGNTGLAAYLATAEGLAGWVGWRRGEIEAADEQDRSSWWLFTETGLIRDFAHGPSKRLDKRDDTVDSFVIQADRYSEVWAATGQHLVVAWSRQNVDTKSLEKLVAAALDAVPGGAPESTLAELVEGPAEQPVPDGVEDSWQVRYTGADIHRQRGDDAGCLARVGEVDETDPVGRERLLELGHLCAVVVEDVAAADRYLAAMAHPMARDDDLLATHASLRFEAERNDEALELVRAIPEPLSAPARRIRADLELILAAEAGDWDRAIELARDPDTSAEVRLSIGTFLAGQTDRAADAKALLASTCPQLEGDQRTECETVLGGL